MSETFLDPECPFCSLITDEDGDPSEWRESRRKASDIAHEILLLLDDDPREAEAASHALIEQYPTEVYGLQCLALVHESLGDIETALQLYDKAIALTYYTPGHDGWIRAEFRQKIKLLSRMRH